MPQPCTAVIHKQARLFDDVFKIDEIIVSHQKRDGTMSPQQRRLIFERGDAVAVLLYNVDTNSVMVVNQFRMPALIARRRDDPTTMDGWMTEAVDGMIDAGETPEQAVTRETLEETGYRIKNPRLIANFFSSPGGISERIFLYFAEVGEADRIGMGGGLRDEDVMVLQISLHEFLDQLENCIIEDPKLLIAAHWLHSHLGRMRPDAFL